MAELFTKMVLGWSHHPKIIAAGGDAALLWVAAIDFSAAYRTNGIISEKALTSLTDRKRPGRLAVVLVTENLWHGPGHDCPRCPEPLPGSYVIHDYLLHQRSAGQVSDEIAAKEDGGAYGNHRRWHAVRGRVEPGCRFCIASGSLNGSVEGSVSDRISDPSSDAEANRSAIAPAMSDPLSPPIPPPLTRVDITPLTPPGADPAHVTKRTRRQAYDYGSDQDFLRFWDVFPEKSGKPAAFKAWLSALGRGADPETVITAAKAYRDDPRRDPDHTKYPQGWLNDERYKDAPPKRQMELPGDEWTDE